METRKVIIIGSGPAGYTAAIYAARANLAPVLFSGGPSESDARRVPGGQLMLTTDVENYPGFPDAIGGPELMENFQRQAARFQSTIHMENVVSLELKERPFHVRGESIEYLAQSLIIATGASAQWLGVKGEMEFMNRGVSACATCDGFFFKGTDVIVVGGGDTAMEEAQHLAKLATSVTVVHRRHSLRASKIMQARVFQNPAIKFCWDSVIEEIAGDAQGVNAALVKHVKTGAVKRIEAKGIFIAIGHQPTNELFKNDLKLQPNGYVWVHPGSTRTSAEGVFACGDVMDATYRQAVTAAGTGCMAAIDAERWMAGIA